jgi:hypothetical protein
MRTKEVDEKLDFVVNAIKYPSTQLMIEQLSMEESLL